MWPFCHECGPLAIMRKVTSARRESFLPFLTLYSVVLDLIWRHKNSTGHQSVITRTAAATLILPLALKSKSPRWHWWPHWPLHYGQWCDNKWTSSCSCPAPGHGQRSSCLLTPDSFPPWATKSMNPRWRGRIEGGGQGWPPVENC